MKHLLLALLLVAGAALAVEPSERLADPALEARARAISAELRCLVCQNESIDDSNADLAHDIRLACHGLDVHDNDFVVGLVGKDLHPLSAVVQAMRKTQQTSLYLDRLGPFFVGRAVWQK